MSLLAGILPWLQVAVAILLVAAVLFQQSGQGLGSAFGGSGNVFHRKRGGEKFIFVATIILAGLFIIISILNLFA